MPQFSSMVIEDEFTPMSVESPLKLQAGVDYYIDHGPSIGVGKEHQIGPRATILHDQPPPSLDKCGGVPISVQQRSLSAKNVEVHTNPNSETYLSTRVKSPDLKGDFNFFHEPQ
jgi:hypothetical protein